MKLSNFCPLQSRWPSLYEHARFAEGYRVLHAEATHERPAHQVRKEFNEAVRLSNGMGFTDSDIFIPPPLVVECQLLDGQKIAGTAILNFNKKHRNWGWKAIARDALPGSM